MTPREMLERFQSLDVDRAIKMTLGLTSKIIIEKNQDQMLNGFRADDSYILPEYTPYTREKKEEKGWDPDKVTLYDTGDFYNAMFADVSYFDIEIDSTDSKTEDLIEKYGEKIFGLSDESKEEYRDDAMPVLIEKIKEILKL